METNEDYETIEKRLQAEWDKASEAGDEKALQELRKHFELNELCRPHPTARQLLEQARDIIRDHADFDGDAGEYCDNAVEDFMRHVSTAIDRLPDN